MNVTRHQRHTWKERLWWLVALVVAGQKGQALTLRSEPQTVNREVTSFPPKYVRWSFGGETNSTDSTSSENDMESPTIVELQTAITTFQRQNDPYTIELHAQLHLADPDYFGLYNTVDFARNRSAILYELLLDEQLLETKPNEPWRRRIKDSSRIQASSVDRDLASQYTWSCQADAIDYHQPKWFHADWTRQEFLDNVSRDESPSGHTNPVGPLSHPIPLWKVAATKPQSFLSWIPVPDAATEATTALLVGPPIIVQQVQSEVVRRRIFTNLFLPGDSLATWLRYVLWIAVPSPEVSILLLDWSSSWSLSNSYANPKSSTTSRVSRIAIPILQALSRGRFDQVRKLVFGQVVLAGHQAAVRTARVGDQSLLIGRRNNHALAMLQREREREQAVLPHCPSPHIEAVNNTMALLFGCNHCPDLHAKLYADGFRPVQTTWRTAWSVTFQDSSNNQTGDWMGRLVLVMVASSFLVVSGADWIATLQEVGHALEEADGATTLVVVGWYLLRHALLYVGLSKLVLDGEVSNRNDGPSGLS